MKKLIIKVIFACIFAFVIFFGGHYTMKATSDDKFCVVCHEWMDPMVKSYTQSVHGGANAVGFKADCTSCHLPHDSYVKYVFKKGFNGVSEFAYMLFNDANNFDWQNNRKNREKFVYDSGCMSCHQKILDINSTNQNITDMHNLYLNQHDENKKLFCVSCHKSVGHKNLGKILYEIKNPPVNDWDD